MCLDRLAGVVENVKDDLLELMGIADDAGERAVVAGDDFDIAGAHFVGEQFKDGIEEFADVDDFAFGGVLAGEAEKAVDDFVAALGTFDDEIEMGGLLLGDAGLI